MDHYCVFGNPIAHSKSPWIHTEFARLTQQTLCYEATLAPLENFSSTVHAFFSNGGKGCNVTVPFKEEAWRLASKRSPHAEKAGAVNTLWQDAAGLLHGDNTDGVGLVLLRRLQDRAFVLAPDVHAAAGLQAGNLGVAAHRAFDFR